MANILTYADFVGTLDLGIGSTNANERQSKLNEIIEQNVPEYFKQFLGTQEYIKYLADCTPSNAYAGTPATAKWTNFLDGTTLTTADGKKCLFSGFKNVLKYFIYVDFLRWTLSVVTNSGNKSKNTKQSTDVPIGDKMLQNWGEGVKLWGVDWNNDFWEVNERNWYYVLGMSRGNNNNYKYFPDSIKYLDTAYNYIYWMNQASADNFPDWEMIEQKPINSLQI